MKVAIMQPYFFPYIGYFQLINLVDVFVVYDDVNYIKKGWINRNNILINKKSFLFSLPLQNMSQNKLINEIFLVEDTNWRISLLNTIQITYKNAPYFDEVYSLIEEIISYKINNLSIFVTNSLVQVSKYLEIKTKFILSSNISKKKELKGEDKIIEICSLVNSTNYINAIGGKELYQSAKFLDKNINLHFLKSREIKYKQFNNEFVPWLSIIDVLMFNSKEDVKEMLNQCDLL